MDNARAQQLIEGFLDDTLSSDELAELDALLREHPEIVERMRQNLEAWRKSCKESADGDDY